MTQSYRERQAFQPKVIIGSRYEGPPLDRPCLRQLPPGWELADETPPRQPLSGDAWVGIACILAAVLLFAQLISEMLGWL